MVLCCAVLYCTVLCFHLHATRAHCILFDRQTHILLQIHRAMPCLILGARSFVLHKLPTSCCNRITTICSQQRMLVLVQHSLFSCHASSPNADCSAEEHAQTSGHAPVPLGGGLDTEGSIAWGQPGPEASSRMFKMVLKTTHGWQLDGQVRCSINQTL